MKFFNKINIEKRTVSAMITLYCNSNHNSSNFNCDQCHSLIKYAHERLENCKFGCNKPSCKKCKVHCFKPEMQEKIKKVMRFSGPKMIYRYPLLSLKNLIK